MRAVQFLLKWLAGIFGMDFVMQEPSIDVAPEDTSTGEPEPDVIVLARPFAALTSKPRAEAIRLLVEVSVTTLAFDGRSMGTPAA